MTKHTVTPPPKLVQQWLTEFFGDGAIIAPGELSLEIANRAAQWGADQELEACLGEVSFFEGRALADRVRAARRPKPLIAVAQAEALIECHEDGWCPSPAQWHVIREGLAESRRALEQLDD
jgi:hypothetical protein